MYLPPSWFWGVLCLDADLYVCCCLWMGLVSFHIFFNQNPYNLAACLGVTCQYWGGDPTSKLIFHFLVQLGGTTWTQILSSNACCWLKDFRCDQEIRPSYPWELGSMRSCWFSLNRWCRGPLAWILTSEIQPLETRSLAQGVTVRPLGRPAAWDEISSWLFGIVFVCDGVTFWMSLDLLLKGINMGSYFWLICRFWRNCWVEELLVSGKEHPSLEVAAYPNCFDIHCMYVLLPDIQIFWIHPLQCLPQCWIISEIGE